jgi:Fe-S-cluster-containing dehydrogenase component
MDQDRRRFLQLMGLAGCTALLDAPGASASEKVQSDHDAVGVLVDTTYCVGCRKCEWACRDSNAMPNEELASYENAALLAEPRRPDASLYTVVNAYPRDAATETPDFVKFQCMHCLDPACASACIVGALRKDQRGPVSYDADKCIGCRYCMVACPFQIPAYEYDEPLTPRVMKCTLCFEKTMAGGERPACVAMCPEGCLIYGRRTDLLDFAHRRIAERPDRYLDHVYGEREVGGTSWLYLSALPMTELGYPELSFASVCPLTEKVQHGIFKNFFPPLALYALLGGIMWLNRKGGDPS